MSKRFIDTEVFKKQFVRGLPAPYKLLWLYITCDCDNAGIWYVDEEAAQLYVGKDAKITLSKALELFNADEKRIIPFDRGKKWFILSFVKFQYGELRSTNPAHKSVLDKLQVLEDEGLIEFDEGAIKPLERGYDAPMDKEMDIDKDMVKVKEKKKEKDEEKEKRTQKKSYGDGVTLTDAEYNNLLMSFGEECTTWCIEKLGNYKLSRGKSYKSDYRAILNWVKDEYNRYKSGGSYPRESAQDRSKREKQQRDLEFAEFVQDSLNGGVP
jgi:hypothetical protein